MTNGHRFWTVLALAAFALTSNAHASTFNVNPIKLHLSSKGKSALLSVRNTSQEELSFQVNAFEWNQSTDGQVELKPTRDIIFFPRMMKLAPGEERKVRVGLARDADETIAKGDTLPERTYRILVEELPSRKSKKKRNQLQILTRMSIPIFVAPKKGFEKSSIGASSIEGGAFSFNLENAGTVHTMVRELRVTARGAGGKALFTREMPGWYVLAGGTRTYQVDLPDALCAQVKSLAVSGKTVNDTLALELQVPSSACTPR